MTVSPRALVCRPSFVEKKDMLVYLNMGKTISFEDPILYSHKGTTSDHMQVGEGITCTSQDRSWICTVERTSNGWKVT